MRILYTFLFYCLLPVIILRLFWRSLRAPEYRKRMLERFGYFKSPGFDRAIWIHAVSLGETITVIPLVKRLQACYPNHQIVITNTTPTGSAKVTAALGDDVFHVYAPYDVPGVIRRFLKKIKPVMCILVETEIWPNYLYYCHKNQIKTVLFNARLSNRSAKNYLRFAKFTRQTVRLFSCVIAQTDIDAKNFECLGISKEKINITGSVKFDITVSNDVITQGQALRQSLGADRPVWIAASTHETEEQKVLAAHKRIQAVLPEALLILVPRHPDRFVQVKNLCRQSGFQIAVRSQHQDCHQKTQIYLGDTLGEMMIFYGACDVAFVGGSFITLGGHNMLEPAVLKKPVLSGPNVINFLTISDHLTKACAMEIVQNEAALANAVITLLQDPNKAKTMGESGYKVIENNRGALDRQFDIIKALIEG